MTKRNATPIRNKPRKRAILPHRHAMAVGAISLCVGLIAFSIPDHDVEAKRKSLPLELSTELVTPEASYDIEPLSIETPWTNEKVRKGDSLSRIFQRVGLNDRQLYLATQGNDAGKVLRRIYPGQELSFQVAENALQALRYRKSPLETFYLERNSDGNGYTSRTEERSPEIRLRYAQATIENSLFLAGDKAQLPHGVIMDLANAFGGVIDFVYDPRKGDTFSVLYEELYLDGDKFDNGRILAASFNNRGENFQAFYYTDANGRGGYYNEDGVSMRKAFLLAPVDFARISSNFNPRRLHPIFKTNKPHRGIDYAASRGTPVYSAGDGRVVRAGYSKSNGNYIVIQHGQAYQTKYLHLHKKHVKNGQKVKQGQIIGKVGSTGYATGPHLHYEFLWNGVHRNPRTIHKKLPKADSIAKQELSRFFNQIQPVQIKFTAYGRTSVYAAADIIDQSRIN